MLFEYTNKNNFLSELGIPSKLALFCCFTLVAMIATDTFFLFLILVFCMVLCRFTGIHFRSLIGFLRPLIPIFLLLFVFSAFTYSIDNVVHDYAKITFYEIGKWGDFATIALTSGGILFGLSLILKMMIMMFASSLLTATSRVEELFYVLAKLGLPYQFGLMLTIAIRFLPTLRREAEQIQQAQKARGSVIQKRKRISQSVQGIIPIFVPMIVSSMRRSNTMAMSMISRGYGYTSKRTQLFQVHFKWKDYVMILLLAAAVSILIYFKITTGFGTL